MSDEQRKGRRAIETGPTGRTVGKNLAVLRKRRGLTTRQLSATLERAGRPIPASGITRMEKGERAVTVDDLAALASVLRVSPLALLLPWPLTADAPVEVTGTRPARAREVWQWADGANPLETSEADHLGDVLRFRLDSRPAWMRSPLDDQYNKMLTESVGKLAMFEGKGRVEWEDGGISVYDTDGRLVRRMELKPGSQEDPGGDS